MNVRSIVLVLEYIWSILNIEHDMVTFFEDKFG